MLAQALAFFTFLDSPIMRILSSLCVLSATVCIARAQTPLLTSPVDNFLNCFQCCQAVDNAFDADLRVFACQEGCQNNIGAIDEEDDVEKTSFDVGRAFFTEGNVEFESGGTDFTLFCSKAADFQAIEINDGLAVDVNEETCQECCTQLNAQFDNQIDDLYSVAACQDIGCDDDVEATNCAGEDLLRDQLGCEFGVLYRTEGAVGFRDLNHLCTNEAGQELKTFGATFVQSCEACCDLAIAEVDPALNADACKDEGCGAVAVCANSLLDEGSCDIGRDFLLKGVATVQGNTLQCFFDHADGEVPNLNVFINVNEFQQGLNLEELIGISVGAVVGVGVLAALILYVRRRRRRDSVSFANASVGGTAPGLSRAMKAPPSGNSSYGERGREMPY